MSAAEACAQLLLKAGHRCLAATRQRADDDAVGGVELGYHRSCRMTQPPRHPVTIDSPAYRFRDNQPDLDSLVGRRRARAAGVHDDIRLRGSHTVFHSEAELGRPSHPVSRREHYA
jgi:hypothetical protein